MMLALATGGQAQGPSVVQLVPTSGWQLVRTGQLDVNAIARFGGDPAVEREYGVQKLELRYYQRGSLRADVLAEETADPVSAYGLLTFYRTEAWSPAKGLDMAFLGPSEAFLARGRTFFRIRATEGSELPREEILSLMTTIGGARLSRDETAAFPAPLPQAGLIPHSEKYVLGLEVAKRVLPDFRMDLIGFTQGAEVRVGTYATPSKTSTVLAVNYPTPQIARVRFGALESLLGINQERDSGAIYGKRSGSFVFLVLNVRGSEAAVLLDQFKVTSEVSWNEAAPEPQRFALELVRMILSVLLLVLVIVTAAVIGGVLVVLSRRVARRFFPDSGWANPEREKVIRLNLQ